MLNAEIDLCESILANGTGSIPLYNLYHPDPDPLPPPGGQVNQRAPKYPEFPPVDGYRAATIGTLDRKGILLLVAEYSENAQFQPPQAARGLTNVTVIVPEGVAAFEISPGRFKVIEDEKCKRVVGGTRITLEEFDTTALLLVTTDIAMARRVEAAINAIAARAAQMAIEQAELKLQLVGQIAGRLAEGGHVLVRAKERKKREAGGVIGMDDHADLLKKASENIKAARENAERLEWGNAWAEARGASRPLRLLMRGLWENARKDMVQAVDRPRTSPRKMRSSSGGPSG